jgi:hypothetical protein
MTQFLKGIYLPLEIRVVRLIGVGVEVGCGKSLLVEGGVGKGGIAGSASAFLQEVHLLFLTHTIYNTNITRIPHIITHPFKYHLLKLHLSTTFEIRVTPNERREVLLQILIIL